MRPIGRLGFLACLIRTPREAKRFKRAPPIPAAKRCWTHFVRLPRGSVERSICWDSACGLRLESGESYRWASGLQRCGRLSARASGKVRETREEEPLQLTSSQTDTRLSFLLMEVYHSSWCQPVIGHCARLLFVMMPVCHSLWCQPVIYQGAGLSFVIMPTRHWSWCQPVNLHGTILSLALVPACH